MDDRLLIKNVCMSQEVWDEICKHGKFGDSVEDVLRRILEMKPREKGKHRKLYKRKSK